MFKKFTRLNNGAPRKYNFCFYGSGVDDQTYGSGKTLGVVSAIVDNWQHYDVVYANFKLNEDIVQNFMYVDPNEITGEFILSVRKNSLVALQEGLYVFDRRNTNTKKDNYLFYALCQMRKRKTDVIADIPKLSYLPFRVTDVGTQYWNCYGNPYYGHPTHDPYFQYAEMQKINSRMGNYCIFQVKHRYMRYMKHYYSCYDTNENSLLKPPEREETKIRKNKQNMSLTQWG